MDLEQFCKTLMQKQYMSSTQINQALGILKNFRNSGINKPFQDILIEKGWLTPQQFAETGILIGPYKLANFLGKGNTAVVYRAQHTTTGQMVALKIMTDKHGAGVDEKSLERFKREVKTVLNLNHPNLIQGFEYGESDGNRYFAMELMEGQSLKNILQEKGKLSEDEALYYMEELAKALQYIESLGVVHRDIKPDNVMIIPPDGVKLCDLGLAKWVGGEEASKTLTKAGAIVGTPYYVSPEIIRGQKEIDIRSDIYSLGATLYHLILGEPPFTGPSAPVVFNLHLIKKIPPYRDLKDQISRGVYYLLKKMLEKEPQDRHPNATALLEEIESLRRGEESTRESSALLSAQKESKPLSLRFLMTLGGLFLALNLMLVYFLVFRKSENPPLPNSVKTGGEENSSSGTQTNPIPSLSAEAENFRTTLESLRSSLNSPPSMLWESYLRLCQKIQEFQNYAQKEKNPQNEGLLSQAVELKGTFEKNGKIQENIFLQKSIQDLEKSQATSLSEVWTNYERTKYFLTRYSYSPLVSRLQSLKEQIERRPEIQQQLFLLRKVEGLERKLKEAQPNYIEIYNELISIQQSKLGSLANKVNQMVANLEKNTEVIKGICRAQLANLPKMSKEELKQASDYFLQEKKIFVPILLEFMNRSFIKKDYAFYLRFFKKYPLPELEFYQVQKLFSPQYPWEQGVARYPFVISKNNGVFSMYYVCGKNVFHGSRIAYAESTDGIQWTNRKMLFEVPSWYPGKTGNYQKFQSFSSPVVGYDEGDKKYHLIVQTNWGGAMTRYILRYISKDGIHWDIKQTDEHIISVPKFPYSCPCLVQIQNKGFNLWGIKDFRELQLLFEKSQRLKEPVSNFRNDGLDTTCNIIPWQRVAFFFYYWDADSQCRKYTFSVDGVNWWGEGTVTANPSMFSYTPTIRGFIIDPSSRKLRIYFHYGEDIYTAFLREK